MAAVACVISSCGGRTQLGAPDTLADGGSDVSPPDAACLGLGQSCTAPSQCCSGECVSDRCTDVPPLCKADGKGCSAATECCSNGCTHGVCCGKTLPCAACTPDDGPCSSPSECCSLICTLGTCCPKNGPCGGTCKPDGQSCSSPSECCSALCSSGVCGPPPTCAPFGPSQCDSCAANQCCPEVAACQADSTCSSALQCYAQCEKNGGPPYNCAVKCGVGSLTIGYALFSCAETQCANLCL